MLSVKTPRNVLVIGAPGTGTMDRYILPRFHENCSYVVNDRSGSILANIGPYLKEQGYEIRVLNLMDLAHSNHYNPFNYVKRPEDVLHLAIAIMGEEDHNSTAANIAEEKLLEALMCYIVSKYEPKDRTFANLVKLLEVVGEPNDIESLDALFKQLRKKHPHELNGFDRKAIEDYDGFMYWAGKNLRGIIVSLAIRLTVFRVSSIQELTSSDDLDLDSITERRTAVFCTSNPFDTCYAPLLARMLYKQVLLLFGWKPGDGFAGRQGIPVHMILPDFDGMGRNSLLLRGVEFAAEQDYGCTFSFVVRSLSRLQAVYESQWDSFVKSCDAILFYGGGNIFTLDELSKMSKGKVTPEELGAMRVGTCFVLEKKRWGRGYVPRYTTEFPFPDLISQKGEMNNEQ